MAVQDGSPQATRWDEESSSRVPCSSKDEQQNRWTADGRAARSGRDWATSGILAGGKGEKIWVRDWRSEAGIILGKGRRFGDDDIGKV